ncbi:MAG: S9 family peptidase [Clostridia bacterium]|nr:S9 family peptidase [Clostridia bacterium]
MKKPIRIDTFRKYRFLSAVAFNKAATKVAFIVKQARGNAYTSDVYVTDLASKVTEKLTECGTVRHFVWLAGDTLLYAVPAGEGTAFIEADVTAGTERKAFTVPVKTLQAIDCGEKLLIHAEYHIPEKYNKPDAAYDVFDELPFRWNAQGLVNGVRKRLYYYELSTGAFTPVTGDDFYVGNLTTSPWQLSVSDKYILFIGQHCDGVQKTYTGLHLVDRATGERKAILPDGQQKVELAQLLDDCAIFTSTAGETTGACQMCEFHRYDFATGEIELIKNYELSTGMAITTDSTLGAGFVNKSANGLVYFTTMEGYSTTLKSIDKEGNISASLTPEGSLNCFDVNGEHIAGIGMYGDRLQEVYVDGERITSLNADILENYAVCTPEYISSQRPGGERVDGWVIKPAGYEAGKKYPGILNIHGGPHAAFGPTYFHEMQVWANAGYFVFYCNPHGSDGKGNAFGDMRGQYGTNDYEDIMFFTDTVLAAYVDIDGDRLGVTGGSYGGYMTNWIIGHTNRFKCAASQRSISDWAISEWISDCGFQRNAAKMGGTALGNPEKVRWHSPITYSENVVTPTLFIHSYEDYRCHHSQAVAMFTMIRQRGVDARLCIFKGENHELSRSGKPENRESRMREILNWMDKYLH